MSPQNQFNKSLGRAIEVLKRFSLDEPELGPADVARRVGMPMSTAHRILATLKNSGLLEQNEKTGKYTIGPDMYLLGSVYLQKTDLYNAAEPVINLLNQLTKEAINISTIDKTNVVYLIFKESPLILKTGLHAGSVLPAHSSAVGRSFLAELSDREIDLLYPKESLKSLTNRTVKTKTELKSILQRIRETGVSLDSEGTHDGIDGIAAVIRGPEKKVVASLCMALPKLRMTETKRNIFSSLIKMGASLISYRLGFIDTKHPSPSMEDISNWWRQVN